jgi:hypothetical protein
MTSLHSAAENLLTSIENSLSRFRARRIRKYVVSTMKRPDFEDVLKIVKWEFQVLRVSCVLQEFKFPPKFLSYLKGHRWGSVVVSRKDGPQS